MRDHNITKDDMKNGDGLRVCLWVSGCLHHCKGCQNPITWNENDGLEFDEEALNEIYDQLDKPYISGITFTGGDPLHPVNQKEITNLCKSIKTKYPDKTIWLYTGDVWENICDYPVFKYVDVLVDGEFKKELLDVSLMWKGSSNQRVIDVKETLRNKTVVLYRDQH